MSSVHAKAQKNAEIVVQAMFDRDEASRALGIVVQLVAPGFVCLKMTVRKDMLNGHKTCHGGFIFSLADSAFAFACNSYNEATVGASCQIEYLLPVQEGDVIQARAVERAVAGKSGIYDVSVINQDGRMVALFRGKSHRISGFVVPELEAAKAECTK